MLGLHRCAMRPIQSIGRRAGARCRQLPSQPPQSHLTKRLLLDFPIRLRDRLAFLLLRQPTHEPTPTRPLYPTRRHLAQTIITTRQPTTTQQPRKTALHQPTTRQHHKTLPRTKHTVQRYTKLTQQPRQQTLLVIRPIRDHYLRRRIPTQHSSNTTRAPRASDISAGETHTPSTLPCESTTRCRLRPFTFLPPSYPRAPLCGGRYALTVHR
jgi:hypothetical protein